MDLIKATPADLDFLVNLRNEEGSARFSKRGKLTAEQIEADYFRNEKKTAYIAQVQGERIGYVIYAILSRERFEISVALTPSQRGKGLGKKLVEAGTRFGLDTLGAAEIIAEIFSRNVVSQKTFIQAGYVLTDNSSDPWKFIYTR